MCSHIIDYATTYTLTKYYTYKLKNKICMLLQLSYLIYYKI